MKQLLIPGVGCAAVIFLFAQMGAKQGRDQGIILINTSAVALKDKAVIIKRNSLLHNPGENAHPLIMSQKDTIPAQLDDMDGDNKWDELFFVADFAPNQKRVVSIKWVENPPAFIKRTTVRFGKRSSAYTPVQPATMETLYANELPKSLGFQRYQTDGPSWENDKVGFRHYLDGRNAKDVFGKLVPAMSPANVGINAKGETEDNYHVMEKWGRDILAVANSVGIGGIALIKGDTVLRLGVTVDDSINNVEKTTFKIISSGPVRSVMKFTYNNWKPARENYQVEEKTSIWPGMYAYTNTVKISGLTLNENLGIGLVNINAEKKITELRVDDKWIALISHEKHTYNKEWWLGLALLVPAPSYLGSMEAPKVGKLSNSFFARLKIKNDQPVNYFAIACWEMSDEGFKDPAYFQQYVVDFVKQLSATIKVNVK